MRFPAHPSSLALIAALAAALALAGCGRKGGLDLPPVTSGAAQPGSEAPADEPASLSSTIMPSRGSKRELPPPPAPKRQLPIDVLLN
jgi:predicted small lipoprotein YifL